MASMCNNNTSNKRRRRNMGANSTKICLRFVDENSGTVPRRSQLQTLKSPLMPTLAESGREESDHDNVISLTYSVPAGLMKSLQETHQMSNSPIQFQRSKIQEGREIQTQDTRQVPAAALAGCLTGLSSIQLPPTDATPAITTTLEAMRRGTNLVSLPSSSFSLRHLEPCQPFTTYTFSHRFPPDLIVEPALSSSNQSCSTYLQDVGNPDEPSFVQLTRLEPVDNDQQSGIELGDYADDQQQVSMLQQCYTKEYFQVMSSGSYVGPETDGLSPSAINRAMEDELFHSVDTVTPSLDLPLYANPPLRQSSSSPSVVGLTSPGFWMSACPLDSSNPLMDEWILKYNEPFITNPSNGNQVSMEGSTHIDENSSSSLTFQDLGGGRGGSPPPNHFPLPPLAGPFSSGFNSTYMSQSGVSSTSFDNYDYLLPPLEPSLDFENIMDLGTL